MATLNLFPARIRFTNGDGTLTPEAYRALQVLFERVGGALGDNGADVFGDLTGVASLDMSLTDTVTQPLHIDAVLHDVAQPVGIESFMPDVVQPANEAKPFDLSTATHAAASKTTPVDADEIPLADSASSFALKKLTWSNLKAAIKTYLSGVAFPIGQTARADGSFTTLSATGELTTAGIKEVSGNVGIGVVPSCKLDVTSGSAATAINVVSTNTTAYSPAGYNGGIARIFLRGGGAAGAASGVQLTQGGSCEAYFGVVQNAAGLAEFVFQGYNGSAYAERMRITANGGLVVTGGAQVISTSSTLANGAGTGAGTITNAPTAGNPTKWIAINDGGVIRQIPSW